MATHSSIFAWRKTWTEEPGRLQSMEFSRPEYWSGQPFHPPGDLPNPGIKPRSPAFQAGSLLSEPPRSPKTVDYKRKQAAFWFYSIVYTPSNHPCIGICCCCLVIKSLLTLLQLQGLQHVGLLCPWDFPSKNIGVNCHFLVTQGSNPCLLHWQMNSLPLSHLRSPIYVHTAINYCIFSLGW